MNSVHRLGLSSWLPLKLFWLSKSPSLFLVVPSSWECAETHQCPKVEDCGQHLDAGWLEIRLLGGSLKNRQCNPFQRKTGRWMFLSAPSVLSLGEDIHGECYVSKRTISFFLLRSCGSYRHWLHWLSEVHVLRSHSSGGGLKNWGAKSPQ